jgi:hypothetical protein
VRLGVPGSTDGGSRLGPVIAGVPLGYAVVRLCGRGGVVVLMRGRRRRIVGTSAYCEPDRCYEGRQSRCPPLPAASQFLFASRFRPRDPTQSAAERLPGPRCHAVRSDGGVSRHRTHSRRARPSRRSESRSLQSQYRTPKGPAVRCDLKSRPEQTSEGSGHRDRRGEGRWV